MDSSLYEAADLLDTLGDMIKNDPQELINIANGTQFQRESTANYFQHLANVLRKEVDNGTKDGQG